MAGRVQQLLSVVLAVDVQQLLAQLPQLRHRHRAAIHPAQVASVSLDLPLEQQLLLGHRDAVFLKPRQGRCLGKHRRHQSRTGSGADKLPAGALAQHRSDGVDDDGFARSGLTGQHVEPRLKGDVCRLDQGDIFNVK